MARVLILDADGVNITLVVATTSRSGARIEQVQTWTEGTPLDLAHADALGRNLRDRLAAWKLSGLPLVVGVGRDRVVLKEIKYPAVPAHEEPAVVRFQAIKEFTEAADELVIDYHPRVAPSASERKALVVAVKKESFKAAQLIAQTAGLKLIGVIPKVYGLAAAVEVSQPSPVPGEAVAVMALGTTGGEFVVCQGDQVLFARSIAGPAMSSDAALLGEIRRNLTVYSGQAGQSPVRALYVAEGATTKGLADRIHDTLAVPVHALTLPIAANIAGNASTGVLAASVGLSRLAASGAFPINFVRPREPRAPTDPHRRPILLGVGLAAAFLLAIGVFAWGQLSSRDRELARLREEINSLTTQSASLEPDAKRYDEIKKWLDTEVSWLDEMYDLTARVSDLNKLRFVQISADPLPLPANVQAGKKHYVGRVTVKGLATEDAKPLAQLMSELVREGTYRVDPKVVGPNTLGTERRSFSQQFSTRYDVEKRPPSGYSRTFTAEVPARKSRNRGPGGAGGFDILNLIGGGIP